MMHFVQKTSIARRFAALLSVVGLASALSAVPGPAAAFEGLLYSAVANHSVPKCEDGAVLDIIRDKFSYADQNILHRNLSIAVVDRIHQAHAGSNDPSPIFRRYCEARANLSNGKHTTLYYLLEQDAGFVGVTWNVEYCLIGLEPWRIHDGRCHTLRHRWW